MSEVYARRERAKNIQRKSTCRLRLQTQMPSCSGAQTAIGARSPSATTRLLSFHRLNLFSLGFSKFQGCCRGLLLDAASFDDDVGVVDEDCTCEQGTLRPIMAWPCAAEYDYHSVFQRRDPFCDVWRLRQRCLR